MILALASETRACRKPTRIPPQIFAGHDRSFFAFFDGIMARRFYCNRLQQLNCGNVHENDKFTKPLKTLFCVVFTQRLCVFAS
jgi:hypothetical protein